MWSSSGEPPDKVRILDGDGEFLAPMVVWSASLPAAFAEFYYIFIGIGLAFDIKKV